MVTNTYYRKVKEPAGIDIFKHKTVCCTKAVIFLKWWAFDTASWISLIIWVIYLFTTHISEIWIRQELYDFIANGKGIYYIDLQATWNKRMNGLTRKTLPGSRCPQKLMGQWIVCINCCLSFSPPLPSPKRKNTLGTLKTINTLLLQTGDGQPLTLNDPYYFEPN